MSASTATTATSTGGIGIFGALGVLFVALKLLGITAVADWSWWWVTAPFWGPTALFFAFLAIAALGALAFVPISDALDRRAHRKLKA